MRRDAITGEWLDDGPESQPDIIAHQKRAALDAIRRDSQRGHLLHAPSPPTSTQECSTAQPAEDVPPSADADLAK